MMKKWKNVLPVVLLVCFLTACAEKETKETTLEATQSQETEVSVASEATEPTTETKTDEHVSSEEAASSADRDETEESIPVATTETIQSVLEEYGIKAGTCLSDQMIKNEKCLEIIKANFNSITLENHMKPDYILDKKASQETGELVVKFSSTTESLLKWCSENGMAMRGHTMIWYSQTPSWIFYENFDTSASLVGREVMLERMESYIRQIFEKLEELGYLEMFYAYDVVNEAWMENGSMRDCLWLQTIGDDYLWYAFYYADKYAPEYIDLYYNDYNEQFKTDTLYNFVQTLVDEDGNYLIDGIGLQAHLYTEDSLITYLKTVEKLGSTGLKVCLTELDICLGTWPNIKPATEENLKKQGQHYYNLIHGLSQLAEEGKVNMDSLTFWGFTDKLSWRKERNPLLFNSKFEPKYAYYGVLQMKEYAGFGD